MNTRYYKTIVISLLLIFISLASYADMEKEDNHNVAIEKVLEELRLAQNIDSNEAIALDKVSEEQLARLGEAVIFLMYPDPREHKYWDNVMGGEGSENLQEMHKWMGYRYIKSGFNLDENKDMLGFWLHGDGTVVGNGGNIRSRMKSDYHAAYGEIIVLLALMILTIVISLYNSLKNRILPLEILKHRLARGEISREEYENLKQDIS